jgi:type VI secretion system protein VasD
LAERAGDDDAEAALSSDAAHRGSRGGAIGAREKLVGSHRDRGHQMVLVRFLIASSALSVALVGGCATVRPTCKVPDNVQLELESSDRLNPDERGRSLPTIVRIYQLTDIGNMEQSAFDDIWERGKETLGDTIVKTDELTIYPGQLTQKRLKRDSKADFLVGVAVFRTPMGGSWRTIQEWPLNGDPCKEHNDKKAAPSLAELRVRMFLENYRIESVNNYVALPKRHCAAGKSSCSGDIAPDELPEARERRLRTFEEDSEESDPGLENEERER